MSSIAFFTIACRNYLPQISILKQSVDATHPENSFTVFLCDELSDDLPAPLKASNIISVADIGLIHYAEMASRYTILELNTAVKPFIFAYLFENGADFVFYLDPDLLLVTPLHECVELISNGANIILTPHTVLPIEDTLHPNDFNMVKAGIYNLGFCGVAASRVGREFIGWWCRKLMHDCRVDLAEGIFVDQKWCDAVPALFDGVEILRHEGYNVGYWNMMHRPLWRNDAGTLMAGDAIARLLHFSGINMLDWTSISKHQDRLQIGNVNRSTRDIFAAYRYEMISNGFFSFSKEEPRLPGTRFFNTEEYNVDYARALAKSLNDNGQPYRLPSDEDFRSITLSESTGENTSYRLPDFFWVVRAMRGDLVLAFPDLNSQADAAGFLHWVRTYGAKELEFIGDGILTLAKRHAVALAIWHGCPTNEKHFDLAKAIFEAGDLKDQAELLNIVNELDGDYSVDLESDRQDTPLPAFLRGLPAIRPDLNRAFNVDTPEGRLGLLHWSTQFLENEIGPQPGLRAFFRAVEERQGEWRCKEEIVELRLPLERGTALPSTTWSRLIEYGYRAPSNYAMFARHQKESTAPLRCPTSHLLQLPQLDDHVTLIGYPRAEMGMGEHIRNTAAALAASSVRFEILDFNVGLNCDLGNNEYSDIPVSIPSGKINIFHINADQTIMAEHILGDSLFSNRYNIGYWAWELERFPAIWQEAIGLVDEIWAPSRFIEGALRQATDKPVIYMPLRVALPEANPFDFGAIGVPDGTFKFLFFFDFNSFEGRKNPIGVINAFRKAFPQPKNDNVALIIKMIGSKRHEKAVEALHKMIALDQRIVGIDETLSGAAMTSLISSADSFVSLHRSEGFGRGMAEAMAAGRIVIGTGYGGNMDFMSSETSYLVDYKLMPVPKGAYVAADGARWADPSIDHAAELMRQVFEHPGEAWEKAASGQRVIQNNHSTEAVRDKLLDRIVELRSLWPEIAIKTGRRIHH